MQTWDNFISYKSWQNRTKNNESNKISKGTGKRKSLKGTNKVTCGHAKIHLLAGDTRKCASCRRLPIMAGHHDCWGSNKRNSVVIVLVQPFPALSDPHFMEIRLYRLERAGPNIQFKLFMLYQINTVHPSQSNKLRVGCIIYTTD